LNRANFSEMYAIVLTVVVNGDVITIHDADNNDQVAEELMTLAYENGVNVFDTAEVYAGGKYEYFII